MEEKEQAINHKEREALQLASVVTFDTMAANTILAVVRARAGYARRLLCNNITDDLRSSYIQGYDWCNSQLKLILSIP